MHHEYLPQLGCSSTEHNKAFNLVLRGVIFQELRATSRDIIQLIHFVYALYVFKFPYNHHNRYGDVIIIPSTMRTRQGDLGGGGALFALSYFRASHYITSNRSPFNCIIYLWTLPNWTSCSKSFYSTSKMCCIVTINLPLNFNTPSQFTTPSEGIGVLGILLGTVIFTSSFIKEAL
jgi:hypothetical protein